jgi:mycothiol synthase
MTEIKTFDPQAARPADFEAYLAFVNRIQAEMWPEDPPTELEELIRELRAIPPFVVTQRWVAWHDQQIIARGVATFWRTEDNKHLLGCDIAVLPEWRRQGLAKRLLKLIAEVAQREKRRLLMASTDSAIPAGEAFMKRVGARVGLVSSTNQLDLALLDRGLLRRWQERAPKTEFELGLWEGPYPEEELDAIVKLREVMNTEPRDNLEIEDRKWTKEQLRQIEASLAERQTERWTIFVRERKTGNLAGYTEVFWSPFEPETLYQGDTGVFPRISWAWLGQVAQSGDVRESAAGSAAGEASAHRQRQLQRPDAQDQLRAGL